MRHSDGRRWLTRACAEPICLIGGGTCLKNDPTYDCLVGPCVTYTSGSCADEGCFSVDYKNPAVPIAEMSSRSFCKSARLRGSVK